MLQDCMQQHMQAAAGPGSMVATAAGAANPSSGQQQQQQLIAEYASHEILVKSACASSQDMLSKLNSMRVIAMACMTAPQQQQQPAEQADRQQLVMQYLQAEAGVLVHCAGNTTAVAALSSMSSISSSGPSHMTTQAMQRPISTAAVVH
jgi:hypothetical protein